MRFLYKQTKAKKRQVFHVWIDRPTKVKFMTASAFTAYRNARTYSYHGGAYEAGEIRFVVPFDGLWSVVVEKGSYHAPEDIECRVELLPPDPDQLSTVALDATDTRDHYLPEADADRASAEAPAPKELE